MAVLAEVVLRSPSGTSLLDAGERLDAASVARHTPDAAALGEAAARLADSGFEVVRSGPVTLTVRGEREALDRLPAELPDLVAGVTYPEAPELFP